MKACTCKKMRHKKTATSAVVEALTSVDVAVAIAIPIQSKASSYKYQRQHGLGEREREILQNDACT